jgi:hypothetical protein
MNLLGVSLNVGNKLVVCLTTQRLSAVAGYFFLSHCRVSRSLLAVNAYDANIATDRCDNLGVLLLTGAANHSRLPHRPPHARS